MKIKRIALVLLAFLVVGLCYLSRPERLQAQSVQPNNFSYPVDPNKVKLPNSPTFKGNRGISPDKLLKKELAISKVFKQSRSNKLVEAKLKTFDEFSKKHFSEEVKADDISPDRLVWEVNTEYPEGVEVNGVKYLNPKVAFAVDAESGRLLWIEIVSDTIGRAELNS